MIQKPDEKTLTYLIGGAIGLLTGLAAAYLINKNKEETGHALRLTRGDGAKIGMGLVSFLKLIAETGK
ncbi:MAG TPA: hypothetical protein PK040_05955 [Anaerolineaceae bacterium]|nr:hypothetical protein [Anaerolineaceae bacterium]